MPSFPQLSSPPIIEAQIDFQVDASAGWARLGSPAKVAELFPSHPQVEPLQQFVLQTNPPQAEVAHFSGCFLRNSAQPTVYQVRRDGFAFSRLQPYEGWESLVGPALEGWERFRQAMGTTGLNGLSLRYINRLEMPRADFVADRDRYFTIAPRVPAGLPWKFAGVSHHSVYVVDGGRFQVAVMLSRDPADINPEIAATVLDIAVSPVPGTEIREDRLTELLAEMRVLKNQAFFSITTEASRKPYA